MNPRALVASLALSPVLLWAGPALAAGTTPPYTDPQAHGGLGLCDEHGHQVTSGSLAAAPFVWKAISSIAAPTGYTDKGAKATLYAVQPRQGVDPADWSTAQLSGSTRFSDPKHPVAQFTYADQGLLPFTQAYPPQWEGFVQLRLVFTGTNRPQYSDGYPAADVLVRGDTWTLVDGATVDCAAPKGVSSETELLPAARLASPKPRPGTASASPAGTASAGPSAGATASAAVTVDRHKGRSLLPVVLGLVVLGLGGIVAGVGVARHRA